MRGAERGYALLLAIAVVAVLSLAVLASVRVQGDVTASAARLSERNADAIAAESLMTRVAFLLLTERSDGNSVQLSEDMRRGGSLRFDGSRYAIDGRANALLSVQDEAGLFNLNSSDEAGLQSLLQLSGQRRGAGPLAAALLDYVDEDDVERDGGGEGRAYVRAGLPPPMDRPFSSRWQALEVLGWRTAMRDSAAIWDQVSANAPEATLNINTAPAPVLEALLGNRRIVGDILRRREAAPFTDVSEVQALTVASTRANGVTFAVSPSAVFRVQAVFGTPGHALHGMERRLELGGSEAARPFRWVEERELSLAPLRDGDTINSLSFGAAAP